jgi:outer membrane protein OmpA-like peptidoglycan-associated protein
MGLPEDEAYFKNMAISQERTRSVLKYIYLLSEVEEHKSWIKAHLAAVGMSSSHTIEKNGREDYNASRRVSFRVITNADIQIKRILQEG